MSTVHGNAPSENVPAEYDLADPDDNNETDPKTHADVLQRYHDGRSPSAWAVCGGGAVAALIIALGAMGPHWTIIIIGIVVLLISLVAGGVLAARGLTNMNRGHRGHRGTAARAGAHPARERGTH